jgi:hypothetical protein
VVDGDKIVVGLTPGSAIANSAGTEGTVVAYEADALTGYRLVPSEPGSEIARTAV